MQRAQPIYGNYRGYYTKRPFLNDLRLSAFPDGFFKEAVVLDVGCNGGWVTCEIAQQLGAQRVIGVDIDPDLVSASWKRRRTVWSQQGPDYTIFKHETDTGTPKSKRSQLANYFPQAMEHMFGPLAIPDHGKPGSELRTFPHNVLFKTAEWVNDGLVDDEKGYDIVIAFSVSKWIHLNQGDEGIEKFFRRVYEVLRPGGKFVIEPQPWESYGRAKRMDAKLKETCNSLQIRPDDFPNLLEKIGFKEHVRLGIIGERGFSRPVDVYTKCSHEESAST